MSASRGGEPPLHVCEICGQKFGANSIDIHVPQCFNKQLSAWLMSDRATRGPKPTPPAPRRQTLTRPAPARRGGGSIGNCTLAGSPEANKTAAGSHGRSPRGTPTASTTTPCPHCGLRVTTRDLPAHVECCNRASPASATRPACTSPMRGGGRVKCTSPHGGTSVAQDTRASNGGGGAAGRPRHVAGGAQLEEATGGVPQHRRQGERPVLPRCYLCGQQFGTTSIAIHVPQCYTKKLAQWSAADPHTRGKPPKHPDTVDWQGGPGVSVQAQSDAQFREFTSNLEACPYCGRKFAADRLQVHLRSCRPGNTSRPVSARSTSSPMPASTAVNGQPASPHSCAPQRSSSSAPIAVMPPSASSVSDAQAVQGTEFDTVVTATDEDVQGTHVQRASPSPRLDPTQNRLPTSHRYTRIRNGKTAAGRPASSTRTCGTCHAVEYEADAKFCRSCGAQLPPADGRHLSPATDDAVAPDLHEAASMAGDSKANSSAGNVCPACGVGCVAEDSFCDRCGSRLRPHSTDTPAVAAVPHPQPRSEDDHVAETTRTAKSASAVHGGAADEAEGREKVATCGGATPATMASAAARFYCSHCREFVDDPDAIYCEDCGRKLSRCALDVDGNSATRRTLPPSHPTPPATATTTGMTITREEAGSSAKGTPRQPSRQTGCDAIPVDSSPRDAHHSQSIDDGSRKTTIETGDVVLGALDEDEKREPCPRCGRMFRQAALQRHVSVCARLKSRPAFNMTRQRLADVEVPSASGRSNAAAQSEKKAPPKKDWRSESEAFRRAMREARVVSSILSAGGNVRDLPPPTYSTHDDYVQCPHCSRRFAADVAERHIPRCATTVNRPKPPPKRR